MRLHLATCLVLCTALVMGRASPSTATNISANYQVFVSLPSMWTFKPGFFFVLCQTTFYVEVQNRKMLFLLFESKPLWMSCLDETTPEDLSNYFEAMSASHDKDKCKTTFDCIFNIQCRLVFASFARLECRLIELRNSVLVAIHFSGRGEVA